MNALAHKADLAPQSAYQLIAVADITPSDTHIQQLRRARFDPAAMAELVTSVAAHGVLQPIVVRRKYTVRVLQDEITKRWYEHILGFGGNWNSQGHGHDTEAKAEAAATKLSALCEIVAGERRWIAARSAKLGFIPAVCRELTDLQVIEIQLIENLQREGLHPLEEAEGFADLMKLKGIRAEAIAETIGRSRSHVFGRLKLLDLTPPAREAFNAGKIDASKAQLIARIPLPKLQAKALKHATSTNWQNEPISFRDFKHWLDNNQFTVALKHATFRLNDAKLLAVAGSCSDCPKRTGNLGDLFADAKDPNVCTDPDCFGRKMALERKRLRAEAEASGRTVISALDIGHGSLVGYIDLDEESDEAFAEPKPETKDEDSPEWAAWDRRADEFTPRTYRQILGDAGKAAAVLLDTGKTLREILPLAEARKLLKPHGVTLPTWLDRKPEPIHDPAARKAEEEKQRERQDREMQFRRALLVQIHAKWKPPLKHEDWVALATGAIYDQGLGGALGDLCYGGKTIAPDKMTDADLMRLLVELSIGECADFVHQNPAPLLALAKRCKIDPTKVKKDLAAAEKATDRPATAEDVRKARRSAAIAAGPSPALKARLESAKKKAVKK